MYIFRRLGSENTCLKLKETKHVKKKLNQFLTVVFEVLSFVGNPVSKKKGAKYTISLPELIKPSSMIDFFRSIPDNVMIIQHPQFLEYNNIVIRFLEYMEYLEYSNIIIRSLKYMEYLVYSNIIIRSLEYMEYLEYNNIIIRSLEYMEYLEYNNIIIRSLEYMEYLEYSNIIIYRNQIIKIKILNILIYFS